MRLSPAQRAEVAEVLAERLDATPADEVQKLWVDEAKERLAVLYSIEADHVLVLAVMHHSRKPGYWRNRAG